LLITILKIIIISIMLAAKNEKQNFNYISKKTKASVACQVVFVFFEGIFFEVGICIYWLRLND